MKKTLLVLLSLAALAAFVGCSNSAGSSGSSGNSSSGGPDLSGVTDTSASWTRTTGWFKNERPYEFTTEDKSSYNGNPWGDGTKFSLSNPGSITIIKIIVYSGNNLTYQGTRDVNQTITSTQLELGAYGAIAWMENNGSISIALNDTWNTSNTMNANQRCVIVFGNNTKLEIYTGM